jgi:hypothetical protein
MLLEHASMSDEKIIRFPGGNLAGAPQAKRGAKPGAPAVGSDSGTLEPPATLDPANLSEDQRKALGIVLSGIPFVLIGIKPTPSGADFFTALGGDAADLRNARDHLDGVIDRAYTRKGV